jgi:hypothetical protein
MLFEIILLAYYKEFESQLLHLKSNSALCIAQGRQRHF